MTAPFAATDRGKDRGSSFLAIKPYASALAVFLASRLAVVLAVLIADAHLPDAYPDEWRAGEAWRHHLLRWDSQWYWTIASEGYRYDGDSGRAQSVVFYPLYPLISRLVASLFGLSVADAMLIVANLAALLASFLLFKLARDECGDDVALFSVAFLGFFPTSIFLSAGYTEPLALVFVLACFLMLRQDRLILAAVFSGLALATRSTGIALLPALAWALWRNVGPDLRRLALYGAPMAALALAGLALFMLYQQRAFGDALAFSHAQAGFHDGTQQIDRLAAALRLEPFARWRFADVSPAGLDQWFFLMFAALTAVAWRRLPTTMALYMTALLLLPYLTLSGGPSGFTSTARFALLSFPAFIALADLTRGAEGLRLALLGGFGALLGLYAALFSQWRWVG